MGSLLSQTFGHRSLYKNQREASLRLSLPLEGKAGDTGETCHRKLSGIAPFRHPERLETSYVR